jgi:DNA mismatch repair protein MutL
VIKELVENSLDAGARRIEIAVEQGGRKAIRVTDDGRGMDGLDLALSIASHATSKIRSEEDLFNIRTMGFRGEALASIASVAQLRLISRPADNEEAHELRVSGGKMEPITAAAAPPGTTVEVRELFFNVPARQKFLRTAQTEMGHITEQLARIALVHPEVEFRLTHNGRLIHHLRPTEQMRSRISDFYGKELADNLMEVGREERGVTMHGLAGRPVDSRSSGKWQYVFLNGRYIRDRSVTAAVREAYRGLIDPNRHPVIFLSITVNPNEVDVNVHPTKAEVRWKEANRIYSQVLSVLRDRFLNEDFSQTFKFKSGNKPAPMPGQYADGPSNEEAEMRRQEVRRSIADFFKNAKPQVGRQSSPQPVSFKQNYPSGGGHSGATDRPPNFTPGNDFPSITRSAAQNMPSTEEQTREERDNASETSGEEQELTDIPRHAMQIHNSYLVAETDEGVTIIDQHALHERVLFEQLSRQFSNGPLESQRLLIPETLDVSPDQVELIDSYADALQLLGFELSPYGPGTLAVHASPTLLKDGRMREFLRDMLDRLADTNTPTDTEQVINDLLSMMACKAAVKAGDPLSQEEIDALMARQHLVQRSSNCPHGRPTTLNLSISELEKQFKRT